MVKSKTTKKQKAEAQKSKSNSRELISSPNMQFSRKACFGTKEFSQNSGICKRCNACEECGKIKAKMFQ